MVLVARSVTEVVRAVVAQHGKLQQDIAGVKDEDDLYAYGLASHATVNVVMALEDELDIEIPDELLTKRTFASIASMRDAISPLVAVG